MQRVVILGSVGGGKSTLATRLSRRTGLPVVHLDLLFWRAKWEPAPREEALQDLASAIAGDRWILDGNFLPEGGDWDARFDRADTVVFLDLSRRRCLWRVVKRLVTQRRASRPDLPDGCREGFDLSVLRWLWSYPSVDRPRVLTILERLKGRVDVHHLASASGVQRFLDEV